MKPLRLVALASLATLVAAAPAEAAKSARVSASRAVAQSCHERVGGSRAGVDTMRVTSPTRGLVRVRLRAKRGDWDLGVFGRRGRRVAGSAGPRSNELAEGFVRKGERLTVRGCRFRGAASRARVTVSFVRLASGAREKVQVVDVTTRTRADKRRLQSLGLDLTEHGDSNSVEVVLHGARDERTLRDAGFSYEVEIADLAARTRANARADRRFARGTRRSDLPSGRDGYRHLADYELELKRLAMRYPGLVKPITLNHKTILGRDVTGIEVTTNPHNVRDGKPVFLMMGVHHAREWPSSEHALEFAYDLVRNYGRSGQTTPPREELRARSSCRSSIRTASTSRARPPPLATSACSTTR